MYPERCSPSLGEGSIWLDKFPRPQGLHLRENSTLDNICIALSLLASSPHDSAVSFWESQWYFCIKMCLASNHSLHRDYDRFKP